MKTLEQLPELTDKQKFFCEEYVIDLNATQAAIRAGYEEQSARSTASHLLKNAAVKQYIRQLKNDRSWKLKITAEAVLQELAWVAFGRTDDCMTEAQGHISPDDTQAAAGPASCNIIDVNHNTGRRVVYKFNLRVKVQALLALCRYLDLFGKNNDTAEMLRNAKFIFPPVALR